jgi:hypothetical protein
VSHTNKKSLSLTGLEPHTSHIGDGGTTTAPLDLSKIMRSEIKPPTFQIVQQFIHGRIRYGDFINILKEKAPSVQE